MKNRLNQDKLSTTNSRTKHHSTESQLCCSQQIQPLVAGTNQRRPNQTNSNNKPMYPTYTRADDNDTHAPGATHTDLLYNPISIPSFRRQHFHVSQSSLSQAKLAGRQWLYEYIAQCVRAICPFCSLKSMIFPS